MFSFNTHLSKDSPGNFARFKNLLYQKASRQSITRSRDLWKKFGPPYVNLWEKTIKTTVYGAGIDNLKKTLYFPFRQYKTGVTEIKKMIPGRKTGRLANQPGGMTKPPVGISFSPVKSSHPPGKMSGRWLKWETHRLKPKFNRLKCKINRLKGKINRLNCPFNLLKCYFNRLKHGINRLNCLFNLLKCGFNRLKCDFNRLVYKFNRLKRPFNLLKCLFNRLKWQFNRLPGDKHGLEKSQRDFQENVLLVQGFRSFKYK